MTESNKTITVLGAGYVGLTTAALLAHAGFTVYVLEPNPLRLNVIKEGKSFFFEDGIDILISTAIENGTLIPTDSYTESVPKSSIVFSCVGTPDNPDGSTNLTYVFSAATSALECMQQGAIFAQKSTVPVGTGTRIETLFAESDKNIAYVSNPEFLREGTAVYDTLYFDRVVAGGKDHTSVEAILAVYKSLESHRETIATLASINTHERTGTYIATSLNSAELIKVTANAFLALKISFANSIAKLSDAVGADINEVMDAVGADERIGRKFLNAGRGFGGGCFPKDVSGLIASGLEYGVQMEIMTAAQDVNYSMPGYVAEKLIRGLHTDIRGSHVAVLGLSFKAGTSDVRKSPGIAIANLLSKSGAIVSVYDPQSNSEAAEHLDRNINIVESMEAATKDTAAVVIATEWEEFLGCDLASLKEAMDGSLFVDAVNRFDTKELEKHGFSYQGVGR